MSGIVLSASVRQNLLSLQSTASLLATTQNNLSTGNKVNSALDNPTSFFTASALNNRASDIGNLLDSIGNGVQVLQAANTGITSLQSLVASAQSIANQVLQTPIGFSAKSSVTTASITGATATNLLGTGTADATFTGAAEVDNQNLVGVGTGAAITGSAVSAFARPPRRARSPCKMAPGCSHRRHLLRFWCGQPSRDGDLDHIGRPVANGQWPHHFVQRNSHRDRAGHHRRRHHLFNLTNYSKSMGATAGDTIIGLGSALDFDRWRHSLRVADGGWSWRYRFP